MYYKKLLKSGFFYADQLFQWIVSLYGGKVIKISGEPYLHHLVTVAATVASVLPFGYEIGLCHDLLEDTGLSVQELSVALISLGYKNGDAHYITGIVAELTDIYTKKGFPQLSKKARKDKEENRLMTISANAQTVKYADLLYNAEWVVSNEPAKAPVYLQRKLALLRHLDKGDPALHGQAVSTFEKLLTP